MNARGRRIVSASKDVLRTREAEASPRDMPGMPILRDAVDEQARGIQAARRPQVGVARSKDGRSATDLTSDPVAEEPR